MKKLRLLIMASGMGTNAEAICDFAAEHPSRFEVVGLLSDKAQAPVLEKFRQRNLYTSLFPQGQTDLLLRELRERRADWLCLAGYMRILPAEVLREFFDVQIGFPRILNVHPSILPAYKGLKAYERAFADGAPSSGVSIHLVNEELDGGRILLQESFPRRQDDSLQTFKARGQAVEHRLYCKALDLISRPDFFLSSGKANA